jgi:hypothetical protein
MAIDNGIVGPDKPSFEILLNETCERLWEKKIQLSLRRLGELDALLVGLEQELDDFLFEAGSNTQDPLSGSQGSFKEGRAITPSNL